MGNFFPSTDGEGSLIVKRTRVPERQTGYHGGNTSARFFSAAQGGCCRIDLDEIFQSRPLKVASADFEKPHPFALLSHSPRAPANLIRVLG